MKIAAMQRRKALSFRLQKIDLKYAAEKKSSHVSTFSSEAFEKYLNYSNAFSTREGDIWYMRKIFLEKKAHVKSDT